MTITGFWRQVATVLSGSLLAQVIPVLGMLILARQYNPAQFGLFSAWLGMVLLLAVILTGRFETILAIEADGEPRRLGMLSTLVTACFAACVVAATFVVCLVLSPDLVEAVPAPLVFLFVPAALAVAAGQTLLSWAAAEGRYKHLSWIRITQAVAITLGQVAIGTIYPSAGSLAIAYFFGVLIGFIFSIYWLPIGNFPRYQTIQTVINFWKKNRRFLIFALPAGAISAATTQLPVLLVAERFGVEVAGLLAMTMRILGAPIGLLGASVLDVFKRYAAASYREHGECRSEYMRTFRVLAISSFVFCIALINISEPFFVFAFGENWRGSGIMALWFLPLFAMRFMANPLSYMVFIAGKQHIDFIWQMALLTMTFTTLSVLQDYELALQAYSAGYSLLYVIYLLMSYRFSLGDQKW